MPYHRSLAVTFVAVIAAIPQARAALPSQYHVVDLGGRIDTSFLNADGVVAGQSDHARNSSYQPRLWVDAQPVELVDPKTDGVALGVNHAGVAVGWVNNKDGEKVFALKWTTPDTWVDVGRGLPSTVNQAVAISDDGDCVIQGWVGESRHSYVSAGCVSGHAVDLGSLGGGNTYATAINASGQVTGESDLADRKHPARAFLYTQGTMQGLGLLPDTRLSAGRGLNDQGHVVGACEDPGNLPHAFFYSNGAMQSLGTLGGFRSDAYAVNNFDIVVGVSQGGDFDDHAFVMDLGTQGNPMLSLQDMLDDSGKGWTLLNAVGINDAGQILVHAQVGPNRETHSGLLIPAQ
jgi:chitinase